METPFWRAALQVVVGGAWFLQPVFLSVALEKDRHEGNL